MKIEVLCHEHDTEIDIYGYDTDSRGVVNINVKPCSQCQSEAYERGIESLLSKGHARNEGEI